MVKYGKTRQVIDANLIRRMCISFSITMATDTKSECAILIAFPRQYWLREGASVYKYIALLVTVLFSG